MSWENCPSSRRWMDKFLTLSLWSVHGERCAEQVQYMLDSYCHLTQCKCNGVYANAMIHSLALHTRHDAGLFYTQPSTQPKQPQSDRIRQSVHPPNPSVHHRPTITHQLDSPGIWIGWAHGHLPTHA